MLRSNLSRLLVAVSVLLLVAVGVYLGVARWGKSKPVVSVPDTDQGSTPEPIEPGKPFPKRALLVGVTKYDHLRQTMHLAGPGNDVVLMRRLLQEQYQFPAEGIVTLTESEGTPDKRPTRANIEREFRRLAASAREGDQVVILMAGHGDQQPEKIPPDPDYPEPDGLDQIFLPADVRPGKDTPMRVHNAIVDDEMRLWLRAITEKKANVWVIFDCCHSGTMTRGSEVLRELPPGTLVPEAEMEQARQRATQREKTRGGSTTKVAPFVAREPADNLVALYACRTHETTPESPQPVDSKDAPTHGLLSYTLVDILTKSAGSKAPLTYRELVQRIQIRYAARRQGAPTPMIEGRGQDRVVLGTAEPVRPRLVLSRQGGSYQVNAGDLFGLTTGSILAVYSPAGTDTEPKLLGHVRVTATRPFEATVEPCAHQKLAAVADLPAFSACLPVVNNYGLRRFKVAVDAPKPEMRKQVLAAIQPLTSDKQGIFELADDSSRADWLIQFDKGKLQLVEASRNREPFSLPAADSPNLGDALRSNLERVFRARNLIALSNRFEEERYRGRSAVDVEVQVLRHKGPKTPGEVWERPTGGWVFRPGDLISFRIHNKSVSTQVDVTLLIVGPDFQVQPFYPRQGEVGKSLRPGETIDTPPPPGEISGEPPFGPECLVVIAVPAKNPPVDFSALAQEGLERARAADSGKSLDSPLGELLAFAMYRQGSRGLTRTIAEQHAMRALTWRTEK